MFRCKLVDPSKDISILIVCTSVNCYFASPLLWSAIGKGPWSPIGASTTSFKISNLSSTIFLKKIKKKKNNQNFPGNFLNFKSLLSNRTLTSLFALLSRVITVKFIESYWCFRVWLQQNRTRCNLLLFKFLFRSE